MHGRAHHCLKGMAVQGHATHQMAAKGPTALATSLAPCANDTAQAENTCRYLYTCSVSGSNSSAAAWMSCTF